MPCLFAQLILTPLLSHVRKPKSQDIRQTNSDYQLMARQKLPLGIQDFEELRRGGYLRKPFCLNFKLLLMLLCQSVSNRRTTRGPLSCCFMKQR